MINIKSRITAFRARSELGVIQILGDIIPRLNHSTFSSATAMTSLGPRGAVGSKEGNVLFNDALNTFYLRLYGVRHMVKNHSDSENGNPWPPYRLLFLISSKGSLICIIPQTG